MKVCVLYSGEVRNVKQTKENIELMKQRFPDADFFYSTWERGEEYKFDFIDVYFEEPVMSYNCENKIFRGIIKNLKTKFADEYNIYRELGPDRCKEENREVYDKVHPKVQVLGERAKGRNRIKQHLIYAMTFDYFCQDSDYDIVVRARYESRFLDDFHEDLDHICRKVYETTLPAGFGINTYQTKTYVEKDKTWPLLLDHVIIHRRDRFDTNHVRNLYAEKRLSSGEGGWYQILAHQYAGYTHCYPYSVSILPYETCIDNLMLKPDHDIEVVYS